MRARLSLTQVFVLAFAGVSLVVAVLFYWMLVSAQRSVVARSERFREAAAARIDARIRSDLGEAADVLADVERAVRSDSIDVRTPETAEAPLFALLLDHARVSDVSLTHPAPWQVSVFRTSAAPGSSIVTRTVRRDGDHFTAEMRSRPAGGKLREGLVTLQDATDPTSHPTYQITVEPEIYGTAIWSDLHYSELDRALPEGERRVVVTVQKAIDDSSGRPAGVVRVGLLARTIDEISKLRVEDGQGDDPHRVFLCDTQGRLLTRLAPGDRLAPSGDDLRVVSAAIPPEIARALASPLLASVSLEHPLASEAFTLGRRRFLLTLRALEDTQDWVAAILVPEDHYTRDLRALRDRFVAVCAIGALCAVMGGAFVLAGIRSGLRHLLATTSRMREFDFAPDPRAAAFRDVDAVVQGLERAKTAMRALGRYVPVDLVRKLYAANREPVLGGELARLTVMFTDIRGFTELSERLSPNDLAQALGHYLEAMTTAIGATGGTIDKFIGDSIMTMWNAPSALANHPMLACRAALACVEATARLYGSHLWRGLPPLVTRFGIHTDEVLVGNFGAPERFNYTVLGDGVNLASRLESLCKQYGVTKIVSDAVEKEAHDAFAFRKLDRVAVKGKSHAVTVFELLGERGRPRGAEIVAYEGALEHYFARRFGEAIALLGPFVAVDPPSNVLSERCRGFLDAPPPSEWDGAWIAHSK